MKGIDRLEGEFAAVKIALLALFTAHPDGDRLAAGTDHMRMMQAERGLFSSMSDDGLKACDALLRLLADSARGSPPGA